MPTYVVRTIVETAGPKLSYNARRELQIFQRIFANKDDALGAYLAEWSCAVRMNAGGSKIDVETETFP